MNKINIHKDGLSTLVLAMIPIGSYYEKNNIKGISHFLEHFCFKETKNRTKTEINNAIEGVGGDFNAYTNEECTCYWAKVANQYKNLAIDVITDLVVNPVFPANEVDKEREVIIQELKMYKDNPSAEVYDLFNEIYYPKDSGFHYSTIGTENTLYNIGRKELKDYHKEHYSNPTLIVIGDVPIISKELDLVDNSNFKFTANTLYKQPKKEHIEERDVEQANLLIGNDVYLSQYNKLDKILMLDLFSLLFNGMSGRLFNKIREENNLVYRIKFGSNLWSGGMISWHVSLGLEKNKIDKALKLIEKELTRPISKKELKETIIKTIGTNALLSEDTNNIMDTVVDSIRKKVSWSKLLYDYDNQIKQVSKSLNDFHKDMNFKENISVGLVPK